MAHELGHWASGHLRKHAALQLLARATLVGGAFVAAIEDSIRYELEADRFAVEKFGVEPHVLAKALHKMHAAATAFMPPRGLGAVRTGDDIASRKSDFRAWLDLYTSDTSIAYWHPSIRERIERLEPMARRGVSWGGD